MAFGAHRYHRQVSGGTEVPFHDLTAVNRTEDIAAVNRVLDSGWLIMGREVTAFQEKWAAHCGVRYAVGVGNGLDAIEIGLRAAQIGAGDEVITTPMTAVATILGIVRAGAVPVLADIDAETGLLSQESVERCLTPKTRALLLVHLYGQMRDMVEWAEFCEMKGIALIEDCAQSHNSSFGNRPAGSWGLFGTYSFYPTKNLGAVGDAGALVTNDSLLAERASLLRNYGQSNRYEHPLVGLNSRMDEIQAAVLNARLPRLAELTKRRREIAELYRRHLSESSVKQLEPPQDPDNHVYHLFVVTTTRRDELQAHLANLGIQTLIHYPVPAHLQPSLASIRRDPCGLPASEHHAGICLSLPCAPHLSDDQAYKVVEAVNSFPS